MPKREISEDAPLIGTSSTGSQVIFPRNCYLEEYNIDFWERLRRNKKYIELCKEIKFDKYGSISTSWIQPGNQNLIEKLTTAKKLFGIGYIIDPKKSADQLEAGMLNLFGLTPNIVEVFIPDENEKSYKDEYSWRRRMLIGDKYITLKIDITQKYSAIEPLLKLYVKEYKRILGIKPLKVKFHFNERMEDYKVYDLKQSGLTPTQVIEKLWPDEYVLDTTSAYKDELYLNLSIKYRNEGIEDWDVKANQEAYKDSGNITLIMRVYEKFSRAKKRIEEVLKV